LPTDKQLYGYGTESKLNLLGYFKANISVNGKLITSKFYVFNGSPRCFMSYKTACELGILSITSSLISSVLPSKADGSFLMFFLQGVGKLKGVKLKLHIDRAVNPVAQPVRRLPFGYRDKVKAKVQELVDNYTVEPVSGVGSMWVSLLMRILQDSGEI